MWSLRVRPTRLPSGATTIAVLKPSPSPSGGPLVQRGVDVDAGLRRHRGGELEGRPARQLLRLDPDALRPGRVDGEVGREGQLLQADEAGALRGGHADPGGERLAVLVGIGVPALLHGADPERLAPRRPGARGRILDPGLLDQLRLGHAPTVGGRAGRRQSPRCPVRSTRPRPPTASACPPSGSRTRAAGWPGPSGPTTGAPRRRPGAGGLRRGGERDRRLGAGDDGGLRRPVRGGAGGAPRLGAGGRGLHRRRLAARHRPDLRRRRRRAGGAASTGASTPGAASTAGSTPPGTATTGSPPRCSRSKATGATGRRSCSRAARSTSTARARC